MARPLRYARTGARRPLQHAAGTRARWFTVISDARRQVRRDPGLGEAKHIILHFVHPANPSKVLTANVERTVTASYLISQLVQNSFLSDSEHGNEYRLVDTTTDHELPDRATLAESGVTSNTTLSILQTITGTLLL